MPEQGKSLLLLGQARPRLRTTRQPRLLTQRRQRGWHGPAVHTRRRSTTRRTLPRSRHRCRSSGRSGPVSSSTDGGGDDAGARTGRECTCEAVEGHACSRRSVSPLSRSAAGHLVRFAGTKANEWGVRTLPPPSPRFSRVATGADTLCGTDATPAVHARRVPLLPLSRDGPVGWVLRSETTGLPGSPRSSFSLCCCSFSALVARDSADESLARV